VDGRQSPVLQLVLDSLRYWITDFHVDGFRFDMAPILARGEERMEPAAAFFEAVRQDPVVSQVKLIAEPWDLGPDGYLVGRFPGGWSEWNGKYRDTVRHFWRGDAGQVGALASRVTGSSDLYEAGGRSPLASINFITCHDGFTLHDLVSYEAKHNEANGEDNRDGSDHNLSRNWGAEGVTDAAHIVRMRERIKRNFLATLAFSQGVPMLSHGDELGRTQQGNNNAYCHDGPLTWIDWNLTPLQRELLQFTRQVMAVRAANPVLRRGTFFRHDIDPQREGKELNWLRSDGGEMTPEDWTNPANHLLGMLLEGEANDTLLLLLNGGARTREFVLPVLARPGSWSPILDTAHPAPAPVREGRVTLATHSLILLRFGS
jgi:isoamylase